MRKQHYTAEIPVSNPYNIAAFEDLVSNIQAGYNEEKRLKNAAFEFMIDRGIYLEFHEWLHAPEHKEHGSDVMGRLRMCMTGSRLTKISAGNDPKTGFRYDATEAPAHTGRKTTPRQGVVFQIGRTTASGHCR